MSYLVTSLCNNLLGALAEERACAAGRSGVGGIPQRKRVGIYYLRPKTHVLGAPQIRNLSKNRQSDVESFFLRSGLSNDMQFA